MPTLCGDATGARGDAVGARGDAVGACGDAAKGHCLRVLYVSRVGRVAQEGGS